MNAVNLRPVQMVPWSVTKFALTVQGIHLLEVLINSEFSTHKKACQNSLCLFLMKSLTFPIPFVNFNARNEQTKLLFCTTGILLRKIAVGHPVSST